MNYAQLVNKLYTFTNFVVYEAKTPLASAIISSNKVNTLLTATSIVNGTFIVICNIEYKGNVQKVDTNNLDNRSSNSLSYSGAYNWLT